MSPLFLVWIADAGAGLIDATPAALALPGSKISGATPLDLEGDGDWDLIAPGDGEARLLRNDGGGIWVDVTEAQAPELGSLGSPRGLLAADLDHDGDVDLVHATISAIRVLLSSGGAEPVLSVAYLYQTELPNFEGTALLDHDQDGWLDVLVADGSTANVVLHNPGDGTAAFTVEDQTPLGMSVSAENSDYCAVADWDADGDTDVIVRAGGPGNNAFLRLGSGWREASGLPMGSDNSTKGAVAFCDLDQAGQLQLLWTQPEALHRFDWSIPDERFVEVQLFGDQDPPDALRTLACRDLDNDGAVDLFLGRDGDDQIAWGPELTTTPAGPPGDVTVGATLLDVDADGDLDVYLVRPGTTNALLHNDAGGPAWRLRPLATVSGCPGPVIQRSDVGATARLLDPGGSPISGLLEVSGGEGRGQGGWPVLHFGGIDPAEPVLLEVTFRYGGTTQLITQVSGSALSAGIYTIAHDDPDGDGIPSLLEQLGPPDLDGDGLEDWLDADADGDGFSDAEERGSGDRCTPPLDTDGDEIPDFQDLDSDNDGLADDDPAEPDPRNPDSDGDGLSDGEEHEAGTDPLDADSDDDGAADGADPAPLDPGADGLPTPSSASPEPGFGLGCGHTPPPAGPWLWLALLGLRRRHARAVRASPAERPRSGGSPGAL